GPDTVLVAASVVVTALLVPLLTAFVAARVRPDAAEADPAPVPSPAPTAP
ncbi:2-keto-3-deoxygluconate permease, partial [Escherichia coli]|nr:2-keto-3-deoxygluconate permease [Escherichia coli]